MTAQDFPYSFTFTLPNIATLDSEKSSTCPLVASKCAWAYAKVAIAATPAARFGWDAHNPRNNTYDEILSLSATIGTGQSDTLKNLPLATGGAAIRPTVAAFGWVVAEAVPGSTDARLDLL